MTKVFGKLMSRKYNMIKIMTTDKNKDKEKKAEENLGGKMQSSAQGKTPSIKIVEKN